MREVLLMLTACLLVLLGFALLALGQERHADRVSESNRPLAHTSQSQRAIAFGAIALGLPCCMASQGGGFGSLLWVVLMSAAAMAVAFTLTWRPHWLRPLAWTAQKIFQRSSDSTPER